MAASGCDLGGDKTRYESAGYPQQAFAATMNPTKNKTNPAVQLSAINKAAIESDVSLFFPLSLLPHFVP
jgi:hypothetical protein